MNPVPVTIPPEVTVPDTSKLAFTSTSVAFNSISSVALISRIALDGALIDCDASLN